MKILAWELAPDNIRVNVVHPIGVNTDMSNNDWSVRWLGEHEDLAEPTRGNGMPAEVVQPEDVSKTVAFLVSDNARYVTEFEHRVDAPIHDQVSEERNRMHIVDHHGDRVRHGRTTVNGVRLHYLTAGEGEPVLLLHGVPKTSYHWRHVIPLLTPRYQVVVPDMRGLGDSEHTDGGYDMANVAEDFAELMTELGHERFRVVGEDWGAAAAYQLAANHPDRVLQLVYQEMILPGFGLEDYSFLTPDNVRSYVWLWHINFYSVPEFPEMLINGHEREYFSYFMKHETHDPSAITPDAIDEYVRCYSSPGGVKCMCEIYRATLTDGDQNRESAKTRLPMPVLAVGSEHFIGADNERQMREGADDVRAVILPWGHQLAEESPEELAGHYLRFFAGEMS